MERFFLDNLWRRSAGLPELETSALPSLESLKESEWDPEFEMYMRNRLVMGAIRYGKMREKGKAQYDRISSMIKRLSSYASNGNKEMLVDVANLAMLEFVECNHPNQHFRAEDDKLHVSINPA